jgi:hypothetical protein
MYYFQLIFIWRGGRVGYGARLRLNLDMASWWGNPRGFESPPLQQFFFLAKCAVGEEALKGQGRTGQRGQHLRCAQTVLSDPVMYSQTDL